MDQRIELSDVFSRENAVLAFQVNISDLPHDRSYSLVIAGQKLNQGRLGFCNLFSRDGTFRLKDLKHFKILANATIGSESEIQMGECRHGLLNLGQIEWFLVPSVPLPPGVYHIEAYGVGRDDSGGWRDFDKHSRQFTLI